MDQPAIHPDWTEEENADGVMMITVPAGCTGKVQDGDPYHEAPCPLGVGGGFYEVSTDPA